MLVGPFPFDRNNPLHLSWDDNLPDQFCWQILQAQQRPDSFLLKWTGCSHASDKNTAKKKTKKKQTAKLSWLAIRSL